MFRVGGCLRLMAVGFGREGLSLRLGSKDVPSKLLVFDHAVEGSSLK